MQKLNEKGARQELEEHTQSGPFPPVGVCVSRFPS